jgi:two-component system, chemotaxis family, sensor kinase CheA
MSKQLHEDDEIRQLFVDESLEALQRVEKLLLEAEQGKARGNMVDTMFRDMHTIKGTSALLGFEKTASLAHAAEDLMSKLRDRSIEAKKPHFARMVEVVDLLRQLIEQTRDTCNEGPLEVGPLVTRLRADLEAGNALEGEVVALGTVPAPSAPVASAPRPAAPPPSVPAPLPAATAPTPPPPPAPAPLEARPAAPSAPGPARSAPPPAASAPPPAASAPPPAASPPPPAASAAAPAPTLAAPAPSAPTPFGGGGDHHAEADGTVRVNVGVLDKLMNLMGELVLARNQMVQLVRALRDNGAQAAAQRLSLVTSDLQEQIMKTRMQPVARVFEKVPRLVRDLCQQTGKRVAVEVEGTATELDKALVEAIRDPVMHIVRNSLDHGIELPEERVAKGKPASGKLVVRAMHEGSTVTIELRDDGRGIDPVKLRKVAVAKGVITQAEADRLTDREATELVFRPGFSTAEKVTNISGRGVGMDVVRTHVERAGGQVELDSVLGKGTVIRMKMPLTLAIIPALLVMDGDQRFAIPQANLLELVYLDDEQVKKDVEYVRGAPIYRLRGEILPLVRLSPLLKRPHREGTGGVNVVVVSIGQRSYGLVVESIHDTEEIVIKPLHSMIKKLPCYAGATVLGDGGVALILDVAGIASMAGIELSKSRGEFAAERQSSGVEAAQSMLIFTAGDGARCAVPVSMVARLEQVECKALEQVAGSELLQYRGELMPVIRPEAALTIGAPPPRESGIQQLLVFNFGRPVGVAVNEIIDTCDVESFHPSDVPGTLGKAVVFGRTTLLVDVFALVRQLAPGCVAGSVAVRAAKRPRVLLADELDAMRASLAGFLRASGLEVLETSVDSVVRELRQAPDDHHFDAVVAGIEGRGPEMVKALKKEQPSLPVVCVARDDVSQGAQLGTTCVKRVEREAVLEALVDAGIFHTKEARAS